MNYRLGRIVMGKAIISQVSGPVARAKHTTGIAMSEEVRIGDEELVGEVIEVRGDEIGIQIYEDTTGLQPGTKVVGTGAPLSVELGPGLMGETFDGIQRPLKKIREKEGLFITPGQNIDPLSREKEWKV